MLSATPLVNSPNDLRWVCRFLEQKEWLSENVPPNTFADWYDLEDKSWQPVNGRTPVAGSYDTEFTNYVNIFQEHADYDSYVHCTTQAWDTYIHQLYYVAFKSQWEGKRTPLTPDQEESMKANVMLGGNHLKSIMSSLMLRRSMFSRIPFKTGKPIVDIPVMNVKTTRLKFANDGSAALYKYLLNNYGTVPGKSSIPAGNRFSPQWRYTRLVSLSPLLAYASFASGFSEELFGTKDTSQVERSKIHELLQRLGDITQSIEGFDTLPKLRARHERNKDSLNAMEYCSPKLVYVRSRLQTLVEQRKLKVVLWTHWPLSQWLVQQVRPFPFHQRQSQHQRRG